MLDYSAEELTGRSLYTLCHGADAHLLRKAHVDRKWSPTPPREPPVILPATVLECSRLLEAGFLIREILCYRLWLCTNSVINWSCPVVDSYTKYTKNLERPGLSSRLVGSLPGHTEFSPGQAGFSPGSNRVLARPCHPSTCRHLCRRGVDMQLSARCRQFTPVQC